MPQQCLDRLADVQIPLGETVQAGKALIPGHQRQVFIHHRDALIEAVQNGIEQVAIEQHYLGDFLNQVIQRGVLAGIVLNQIT